MSKNAEFFADLQSVEKVVKNAPKKIISKNITEICSLFTFTHVCQTCFAYNFCVCIFLRFPNRFKISVKFCVFYIFFGFKN